MNICREYSILRMSLWGVCNHSHFKCYVKDTFFIGVTLLLSFVYVRCIDFRQWTSFVTVWAVKSDVSFKTSVMLWLSPQQCLSISDVMCYLVCNKNYVSKNHINDCGYVYWMTNKMISRNETCVPFCFSAYVTNSMMAWVVILIMWYVCERYWNVCQKSVKK